MVQAFLAGEALADHPWLWGGDGRITVGHLAVLAERAAAGPLELILFAGVIGADWTWSQRDEAMARGILAASRPGARLYEHDGELILDLPLATEAVVPHRPQP